MISFREVKELNRKWNVIPVYERIPADLDTPVGAFIKLASKKRESFLLESIEGGEKLARYSFLGFDPFLVVEGTTDSVMVKQGRHHRTFSANPVEFLQEMFSVYKPFHVEELPNATDLEALLNSFAEINDKIKQFSSRYFFRNFSGMRIHKREILILF